MGLYYLKVTRIIIGHAQDLNDEQGKKFFYCNPFKKNSGDKNRIAFDILCEPCFFNVLFGCEYSVNELIVQYL